MTMKTIVLLKGAKLENINVADPLLIVKCAKMCSPHISGEFFVGWLKNKPCFGRSNSVHNLESNFCAASI